ncbi:MAG: 3-methyladenine DNA glycosylase [Bacteroidota bacterium]
MIQPRPQLESFITQTLSPSEWKLAMDRHRERVSAVIDDYLVRRSHQEKQPVMDFLFEYYKFRPSHLKHWSPGFGVRLEDAASSSKLDQKEMRTQDGDVWLDPADFPEKRLRSLYWIMALLESTQENKPHFGCFGMHEWAMVYRADEIRHPYLELRLSDDEIAAFVESRPVKCTHFDAFRFFTPQARPLNKFQPTRETFIDHEQPGCVHSNMDLYKWAYKFYPWISSEIIWEAFELAVYAREIDMRASPYDMSEQGYEPIKVETEEGRAEYLRYQKKIWQQSLPVRAKLLEAYQALANHLPTP